MVDINSLGPLPRSLTTTATKCEFNAFLIEWQKTFRLTFVEMAQIFCEETAGCLKYALRQERHPNSSDKGADEL